MPATLFDHQGVDIGSRRRQRHRGDAGEGTHPVDGIDGRLTRGRFGEDQLRLGVRRNRERRRTADAELLLLPHRCHVVEPDAVQVGHANTRIGHPVHREAAVVRPDGEVVGPHREIVETVLTSHVHLRELGDARVAARYECRIGRCPRQIPKVQTRPRPPDARHVQQTRIIDRGRRNNRVGEAPLGNREHRGRREARSTVDRHLAHRLGEQHVHVAGVRVRRGQHALAVWHLRIGKRLQAGVQIFQLKARLLCRRVETHRGGRAARRTAAGRLLDLHDAAPLPNVIVDEAVRRQVLAGEHAGGGSELHEGALRRLKGRCFKNRGERGIGQRVGGDASRVIDGKEAVARRGGRERKHQRRTPERDLHHDRLGGSEGESHGGHETGRRWQDRLESVGQLSHGANLRIPRMAAGDIDVDATVT